MNILIVDSVQLNHLTLTEMLVKGYFITNCFSASRALDYIDDEKYNFDCIIINMLVSGAKDLISKTKLSSVNRHTPIIGIIVSDTYETRLEAFTIGVYDFLCKPFDEKTVISRIEGAIAYKKRFLEFEADKGALSPDSLDPITGILNYDAGKWLIDEITRNSDGKTYILVLFKVDSLEKIYAEEGQNSTEMLLRRIGNFIVQNSSREDICNYLGNGEFATFFHDIKSREVIEQEIDHLIRMLVYFIHNSINDTALIKIGFSYSAGEKDFEALLREARTTIK